MPSYYYRARDASGRPHEGIEVAQSEDDVLRTLSGLQLTPVSIEVHASPNGTPRVGAPGLGGLANDVSIALRAMGQRVQPGSVALFARQLSTMISAGLPLVRAMRSIARDHHDRRLAGVLQAVGDDVQKGDSLAMALSRHPHVFDEVFVSLVQTGEFSGTLDQVMDHTANYLERAEVLRLRVEAALRYPIFVLTFAVLVFLAMIFKIVPMFSAIYERFKVELPLPTRMLLEVSQFATRNVFLFILLALLGWLLIWSWARSEQGRLTLDRIKLKMPLFGPLIAMYAVTKFSRTLGILIGSGTQILTALKVMRPVPGNKVLEKGIDEVRGQVEEGISLSRALGDTGVFPDMLVQMSATGEETGKLDHMLSRTADFYEQRVTAKVEGLSSLVEPIAIVVLGVVIGVMLMALYLPIFNLGQAMRSGLTGH
ncbi:MAG: type II secretion system F family protein [Candidatus Eisenbacteria bacterium]|nr:type II secretion system F family protein [Candidatus Eisenbacteria bacterium]